MAFARTHALTDGELVVFWDNETQTAKKVLLSEGEAYAPYYPSENSLIIYAACDVHTLEDQTADEQIAIWEGKLTRLRPPRQQLLKKTEYLETNATLRQELDQLRKFLARLGVAMRKWQAGMLSTDEAFAWIESVENKSKTETKG